LAAAGLALAGLPALGGATATIQFDPGSSTGFPTLSIPVGVRATGMGDVYTAVGDDVYALRWNPAGLAGIKGFQLGVMDNEWSSALGLRQDYFGYGQALDQGAALALAVDYFNLGTLDQRDSTGALLGSVGSSALALSGGYAWHLLGRQDLQAGLGIEADQQTLFGASTWAYGASAGALWQPGGGWALGVSADHLGLAGDGSGIPSVLQAGLASRWLQGTLLLAADAEVPAAGTPLLKAGMEVAYGDMRFRTGWRQALGAADDALQTGLTAGVGFRVGSLALDYSYVPYGDLSIVHRVQATLDLPRDFFQPRVAAVAEGTTASAQAYFLHAVDLERQGETLKALVEYQRSVENYPPALRSKPLPFLPAAMKKVEDLQSQLAKGGDHSQIQKLTHGTLVEADRDLKAGRFKEALARLDQAQKLDPDSADLKAKVKEVQASREAHLGGDRAAAHAPGAPLEAVVAAYLRILAIDPADADALAYLTAHRRALKQALLAREQAGIFQYLAGKLEDAIKVWSQAQDLDYFGEVDFKRDIDKARKQMELRAPSGPTP
jgi:tetratricopeptide (TPR) repeat protein